MILKKLIPLAVLGGIMSIAPSLSSAATFNTTTAAPNDGILQNFTGIDWHSNGGGWVQGFDLTNLNNVGDTDTFTFTYQAFAGSIETTSATPNLYVSAPGPATGGYEVTTFSVLQETATCLVAGCSTISITTNSGTWAIYFDNTPNANQSAGTGFLDGTLAASGTWTGGNSVFTAVGGGIGPGGLGTGSANIVGTVLFTDNNIIDPDLLGTDFQASLSFPGQNPPSYTRPSAFNGVNTVPDTATDFVLQTDGSQSFTEAPQVPEPATMFLMGLGFLGLGFTRRRA